MENTIVVRPSTSDSAESGRSERPILTDDGHVFTLGDGDPLWSLQRNWEYMAWKDHSATSLFRNPLHVIEAKSDSDSRFEFEKEVVKMMSSVSQDDLGGQSRTYNWSSIVHWVVWPSRRRRQVINETQMQITLNTQTRYKNDT